MDADYSVELTAADPALELPWSSDDPSVRYFDLRCSPELISCIPEAAQYPELADFLSTVNSTASVLETAKCDCWTETELNEAEDIYGANLKFASYVDLLFATDDPALALRFSLDAHELLARRLVRLLSVAPQISAAAEFAIRRCYYHAPSSKEILPSNADSQTGYYITFYLFGYGEDESSAHRRWTIALNVVQNALLQVSAEMRRLEPAM